MKRVSKTVPVIVVGGGPAGCACAIRLASAGVPVRLLERKRRAHHKVCGEFISWEAAASLEALGVDLYALGAEPIRHMRMYSHQQVLETPLPQQAWSLSRQALDEELLVRAQQAGVDVRRGLTVRKLQARGEHWHLRLTSPGARTPIELARDTVFLATGKHELHSWHRVAPPQRQSLVGLKMHFNLEAEQWQALQQSVEIHLFDGGYAGLEPVEQGRANLCFLIQKEHYAACNKSWADVLLWLQNAAPMLKQRLAGAEAAWTSPLAISEVPYGYVCEPDSVPPGLYRLGDQAAVIPSFAGDGIAIALHSGELAARAYLGNLGATTYHQHARQAFHPPVAQARRLALLFQHAAGRRLAFAACRLFPSLMTYMMHRTRVA